MGEQSRPRMPWQCPRCLAEFAEPAPPTCSRCGSYLHRRPDGLAGHRLDYGPKRPKVVTAQALVRQTWATRPAGARVAEIVGARSVPATMQIALAGPPSAGKSTLAVAIAEDGTWARPLYVPGEEGLSKSVGDRLGRAEASRLLVTDAGDLPSILMIVEEREIDLVVLDSVDSLKLGPAEIEVFRKIGVSAVFVLQATKAGGHRGPLSWVHDCDLFVWVEGLKWKVVKSWLGQLKGGDV